MRRRLAVVFSLLAASLTAVVLAACGSDSGASAPTELVPAGSVLYGEATIEPGGDQKTALDELARKLPGDKSPGALAQDLLSRAFEESDSGLDYDKDVKPWVGEKAAFFATRLDQDGDAAGVAALVQAEDEEAANAAIDKAAKGKGKDVEYKGVEYRRIDSETSAGIVEGYLVTGSERGLKAAIDVVGDDAHPIEESDAYKQAIEDVPEDRLGLFYINTPKLYDNVKGTLGSGVAGTFQKLFSEPYVISADADAEGVEFLTTLPQNLSNLVLPLFGEGTDLIEELPGDSWGAIAQPDLGKTLDYYVDLFGSAAGLNREAIEQQVRRASGLDLQRDVIGWMGDFGLFVRGTTTTTVNGALLIETSDPAASDRALASLRRQFVREGDARVGRLTAPGGGKGYTVRDSEVPQPVHIFRSGERVVVAYGDESARDAVSASEPLGDNADFSAAADSLGDGYEVSTYIAMDPIVQLAESSSEFSSDEDWQKAKPYFDAIGAVVGGTRKDGEKLVQKIRITVP